MRIISQLQTRVNGKMSLAQKRKGGLVWYMDGSKTDEGTGAGVYRWGLRKGIASVLDSTPP